MRMSDLSVHTQDYNAEAQIVRAVQLAGRCEAPDKLSNLHCSPDQMSSLGSEPQPAQGKLVRESRTKQFKAGYGDGSGFVFFEAKHRSGSELDPAMVLFDKVVEVLGRSQLRALG